MSENENKVTPSEPSQSERDLAKAIINLHEDDDGAFDRFAPAYQNKVAHLIHAENERQKEVLQSFLHEVHTTTIHHERIACGCLECRLKQALTKLLE